MPWHARLHLSYQRESARTVARFRHDGPLRILQSLYPEGDAVCHNVLVHPPGGLVGGDTLDLGIEAADGSHSSRAPAARRMRGSNGCRSKPSATAAARQRTGFPSRSSPAPS